MVVLFIVFSLRRDVAEDEGDEEEGRGEEEGGKEGEREDGRLRLESEMEEDVKWEEAEWEVEGRGATWKQNDERLEKIVIAGSETRYALGDEGNDTPTRQGTDARTNKMGQMMTKKRQK